MSETCDMIRLGTQFLSRTWEATQVPCFWNTTMGQAECGHYHSKREKLERKKDRTLWHSHKYPFQKGTKGNWKPKERVQCEDGVWGDSEMLAYGLERCGYSPGNAGSHQKLQQAGADFPLEPLEKVAPWILDFWPRNTDFGLLTSRTLGK